MCSRTAEQTRTWLRLAILQTRIGVGEVEKLGHKKLTDLSDSQFAELRQKLGNQRLLGMDYYSGGHLTHGYRFNLSAQLFDAHSYTVNRETGLLDYDELERRAVEVQPLILLAGFSAYPRKLNFRKFREIADRVGAT